MSTPLWWRLPGPSSFVDNIVDYFHEGRNVVLCFPEHAPSGLDRAIKSHVNFDSWYWDTIDIEDTQNYRPIDLLYERYACDEDYGFDCAPEKHRSAKKLCTNEHFAGQIIYIRGMQSHIWPVWREWLIEYEQACRTTSLIERSVFCVPLYGEAALDPPPEEVCLSIKQWNNTVDNLDMNIFAGQLLKQRQMSILYRQLAVSILSELSLWDFQVTELLAKEDIEVILNPYEILRNLAQERRWDVTDCKQPSWCQGQKCYFEGEEKIHSALLSLYNNKELDRRIWKAQVRVLMPYIEERRQDLIISLERYLKVPFTTQYGQLIEKFQDLEIGNIDWQIAPREVLVDPQTKKMVSKLKQARNLISHLENVGADLIKDINIDTIV